jgi:hypothetical protein
MPTELKAGDRVESKRGRRYKLIKARSRPGKFRLQNLATLQIQNGEWTGEQLLKTGAVKI